MIANFKLHFYFILNYFKKSFRLLIKPETEFFRKYIDKNFPDLTDIAMSCPLAMVNSNELYNLPRPTLHKIIYIGGLGMKIESVKPLPQVISNCIPC